MCRLRDKRQNRKVGFICVQHEMPLEFVSNLFYPSASSNNLIQAFISRNFSALIWRFFRVSHPCMKLASAQRFRPCSVLGPVEAPPCERHTDLPRIAALRHCNCDLFERAWHRGTGVFEPKRVMWVSLGIGMPNHSREKFSHHPMNW